ncbi:hypothetical protein C8J56DRAFT_897745 [Mycena floridula]|nr:hypothetical protein C8J56DRAFT_897745 [Mycena floridula]
MTSEGRNSTRTGLWDNVANSPAFWGCISINAMRNRRSKMGANGRKILRSRASADSLFTNQFSCPLDQVFDDQYSRALTVLRASEFDGFIHLGLPRQGIPNVLATTKPCLRQVKAKALVKSRPRLPLSAKQAVEEAYSGDRVISARMSNHLYPDFDHHSLEEIRAEEIRGFISEMKEKTDGDDGGIRRRSRSQPHRRPSATFTTGQNKTLGWMGLWLSTRSSAYDQPKPPPSLKDFQAGNTASLLKECARMIWDGMEAKHEGPVPVLSEVGDIKSMDARRHGLTPSKAVLTVHRGGFGKWPPRSISQLGQESDNLTCPGMVLIFPILIVSCAF